MVGDGQSNGQQNHRDQDADPDDEPQNVLVESREHEQAERNPGRRRQKQTPGQSAVDVVPSEHRLGSAREDSEHGRHQNGIVGVDDERHERNRQQRQSESGHRLGGAGQAHRRKKHREFERCHSPSLPHQGEPRSGSFDNL